MLASYTDHRADPSAWARSLAVSTEAIDLYLASDVIDLHVDSFIWTRVFGYDLLKRHGRGLLGARCYSQADLPRMREAAITGAMWSITTNPARSARGRQATFARNLAQLQQILSLAHDDVAIVRNADEYTQARAAGKHAAWIAVQGGNALDAAEALELLEDDSIIRITLVHLSSSRIGSTSSPLRLADEGLTEFGKTYVKCLDEKRIFVDLAHLSRKGFSDAVEAHDRSLPLIVTHTGVAGVTRSWRNLDDEQLRMIADSGGTIGIMYHSSFLGDPYWGGAAESVVDHLEYVCNAVGDSHASLGSDWDGAIVTPRDMPTCLELPRLVQLMLDRGWSSDRIQKICGGNFLRALRHLRG